MRRHETPATPPLPEAVLGLLAAFRVSRELQRKVPAETADKRTLEVPATVVRGMVALLELAAPANAAAVARLTGDTTQAISTAFNRFVDGRGNELVTKTGEQFELTKRGRYQAKRFVHAGGRELAQGLAALWPATDASAR